MKGEENMMEGIIECCASTRHKTSCLQLQPVLLPPLLSVLQPKPNDGFLTLMMMTLQQLQFTRRISSEFGMEIG